MLFQCSETISLNCHILLTPIPSIQSKWGLYWPYMPFLCWNHVVCLKMAQYGDKMACPGWNYLGTMHYQYDYRSTTSLHDWANMTIHSHGLTTLKQHSPNVTFHLNRKPHWHHVVYMKHSVCHLLPTKPPSVHVGPIFHGYLGSFHWNKMKWLFRTNCSRINSLNIFGACNPRNGFSFRCLLT